FMAELLGDASSDTPEAADDVVVAQRLDRPSPPPLRPETADHSSSDRLDDQRADVRKDTDPGEHEEDRQDTRGVVLRHRVESRQRARDDRPIERLQPRFVERRPEADGADPEHDAHRGDGVAEAAEAEGVLHPRSIVGPWTTSPRRASATSIWIPSRWQGCTRI